MDEEKVICPVCGEFEYEEYGDYDVCPICGWFNDSLQNENPDYAGGCNALSVNEHRKRWKEGTLSEITYEIIEDNKNRLPKGYKLNQH